MPDFFYLPTVTARSAKPLACHTDGATLRGLLVSRDGSGIILEQRCPLVWNSSYNPKNTHEYKSYGYESYMNEYGGQIYENEFLYGGGIDISFERLFNNTSAPTTTRSLFQSKISQFPEGDMSRMLLDFTALTQRRNLTSYSSSTYEKLSLSRMEASARVMRIDSINADTNQSSSQWLLQIENDVPRFAIFPGTYAGCPVKVKLTGELDDPVYEVSYSLSPYLAVVTMPDAWDNTMPSGHPIMLSAVGLGTYAFTAGTTKTYTLNREIAVTVPKSRLIGFFPCLGYPGTTAFYNTAVSSLSAISYTTSGSRQSVNANVSPRLQIELDINGLDIGI